jgi:fructokinase
MKEFDVVTLGEMLIDMFPGEIGQRIGEVESFIPKPGGAPANAAVAVSRLGSKSAFIGKLGDDLFGTYLNQVLEQEGVDTRGVCFDKHARTTMAIIAMPDQHSAEFVFYRNPGADQRLSKDDLDFDLLNSTKALHFGSVSLTDEPARSATLEAARFAREAGALVSFDVNYRPSLWKDPDDALLQSQKMLTEVDMIKVNQTEAALLIGVESVDAADPIQVESAAIQLLSEGPDIVIVTLGEEGSYFQISDGGGYIPPFRVKTVDAVGCGDAFIAGLLSELVKGDDWRNNVTVEYLKEAMTFANAVGALTSLKRGALPALPTMKEVEKFIKKNKR